MSQEQVSLERLSRKVILVQIPLISRPEFVSCSLTRYHSDFMSIDQGPCTGEGRVLRIPIECPDERDDEGVVRP